MTDTSGPDWAWAVLDRIITPNKTGFTEHHTIAVSEKPDPRRSDYVNEPEHAYRIPGLGYPNYGASLDAWQWQAVSDLAAYPTRVRKPTVTRTRFGAIEPYRGVLRVRRTGLGTAVGTVEPVAYGATLTALVENDPYHPIFGFGAIKPETAGAIREILPEQIRAHGWPIIGIDPYPVCRIVAEQVAYHHDAAFRTQSATRVADMAARGDIDPEHAKLITRAGT